ncbi:MAG: protoporphyrinogen oxidase [Myxococcota bacterium]|nr:protoporphyrinogen oxidase [Myxococcota bacterium]
MADILILGAGVSGLAVAEWLRDDHNVQVLEAGPGPGGKVSSEVVDGFTFDRAANGWLDNEPAMERLLLRAGLSQQVVKATPGGTRYVVVNGKMTALPAKPPQMLTSPVLTLGGKLRMAWDLFAPGFDGEESVAQFVRRRLGQEALERLVQPMVTGIYAGDVENMSVQGAFPKLKELERQHGSLLRGAIARRSAETGPSGTLTSLVGGAGVLTRTLAERATVHCNQAATGLERVGERWRVQTAQGSLDADAVVVGTPAYVAAELTAGLDTELSQALGAIPYAPVAVVGQGLPRSGWDPPEGFGVLVPEVERMGILGTLFTSSIFPSRAPEDGVTLRTLLGGALHPRQALLEPEALVEIARREVGKLVGELPPARVIRVYRHERAIPQYTLGHPGRVEVIEAAEQRHRGLVFVGNHLRGIGVKDCARTSEGAVRKLQEALD